MFASSSANLPPLITLKTVFLDYATMGPDLDLSPLSALVDEFDVYDVTESDQVAERITQAVTWSSPTRSASRTSC